MSKENHNVRPVAFVLVFFAVWIARLAALPFIDPPKSDFLDRLAFGTVGRLLVWVLLPVLWLVLVEQRTVASAFYPVRRRSGLQAIALAMLLPVILSLGMRLTRGQWYIMPAVHSVSENLAITLSNVLLALGEEFTFRGVFLSGLLRRGLPFWAANMVVALVFALSHWPGWLMFGGMPLIDLATASARVLVFGLLMGGLVRVEGGLFAAIIVHSFNNLLVGTLF